MAVEMTRLETLLKERFLQYYGQAKPIVTKEEMDAYLHWLVTSYSGAGNPLQDNSALGRIAEKVNQSKGNALAELLETNREHSEIRFLRTSHDISVGRMFRYMPAHWHTNEFFEMYYCTGGRCPIVFEQETVELRPGDVLLIAPGALHASPCYADDAVLYYYMLRSSTFDRVFWNQLPSDSLMAGFFRLSLNHKQHAPYLHFQTGGDAEIARLLEQIAREFTNPEPYGEQLMNALMSVFFVLLLRRYEGTARLPRTKEFQWKHEFSAIFSYIQQHYADRTLAQVAAEFHYSERQLSRIVETATGESYAQLTRRLRMERAAALLKLRELRLETVSETCGYASVPSFSRAFQDWYGTTPAKYRREQS